MSAPAKHTFLWLCLFGAMALATHAVAATKKDKEKEKDAPAKPALVGTYCDWSVYQSQSGKSRICYALASPKDRSPGDIKRDSGYAFISERPGEHVRNEVSFVMGFDLGGAEAKDAKDSKEAKDTKDKKKSDKKPKAEAAAPAAPTADVGDTSFDLLPKGTNLWVKNPAEESQLIDAMRKGSQLKIHASARKGGATVDTYSLSGFSQAIDRALKDCPGA